MFLGGSILSFVLPMAAFIVIAGALFWLYRRPHHNLLVDIPVTHRRDRAERQPLRENAIQPRR